METLTGEELAKVDFEDVRGTDGIKEATYNVAGMDVKVAVASGLRNAKELLDKVNAGEADYHFIEIMGCPGGLSLIHIYIRWRKKMGISMD